MGQLFWSCERFHDNQVMCRFTKMLHRAFLSTSSQFLYFYIVSEFFRTNLIIFLTFVRNIEIQDDGFLNWMTSFMFDVMINTDLSLYVMECFTHHSNVSFL